MMLIPMFFDRQFIKYFSKSKSLNYIIVLIVSIFKGLIRSDLIKSSLTNLFSVPLLTLLFCSRTEAFGRSKSVKFADGVLPGEGTSPSCGEEIHSPPPPSEDPDKPPRGKKLRKKNKPRNRIVKLVSMSLMSFIRLTYAKALKMLAYQHCNSIQNSLNNLSIYILINSDHLDCLFV